MAKEDVERLSELAKQYLNVKADESSHIRKAPEELIPGSYRWGVFMYSNLFISSEDTISFSDKVLFIRIFKKLQDEHTICWSRDKLYELDTEWLMKLKVQLYQQICRTESFYELRVCLYLWRMLQKKFYAVDDYMLVYAPFLMFYTKENFIP